MSASSQIWHRACLASHRVNQAPGNLHQMSTIDSKDACRWSLPPPGTLESQGLHYNFIPMNLELHQPATFFGFSLDIVYIAFAVLKYRGRKMLTTAHSRRQCTASVSNVYSSVRARTN